MLKLLLASASPRRKYLLRYLTRKFEVQATRSKEPKSHAQGPVALAHMAARIKAEAALRRNPGRVILAADTIVVLDRRIFGKPLSTSEARRMLSLLSGRTHRVITAIAVARPMGAVIIGHETSKVKIKKLSEAEIRAYVRKFRPLDKAGAYAIQDRGKIVESYKGCFCNIMGLPLLLTRNILQQATKNATNSKLQAPISCSRCPAKGLQKIDYSTLHTEKVKT